MGTRIFKNRKGTIRPIDASGKLISRKLDLKTIKDKQMDRYKILLEEFKTKSLDDLKLLIAGKRSSTDREALVDAMYLKAKEKYDSMTADQMWELYNTTEKFSKLQVTRPEARAIMESFNHIWETTQTMIFEAHKDSTLDELKALDRTGFNPAAVAAIDHLISISQKEPVSV